MSTQDLLYILPEMAFTVRLEETSKSNYFFAQSFHQINGEFIDEENFLLENLKKLFERVEPGEYTLVLPDFLFTDTIISVPKTDDQEIAAYLRNELLPKIEVSTFTHETCTSVLLQRGKTSKVQLSALEKELSAQVKLAIGNHQVKIKEIVPLSWTLKAAVSLEPSITIAQLGESLYLAEHFVGINQTNYAKIDDLSKIEETVKTLKGADANLQTVYLFTSNLVEEKLKKALEKVLPIQQLVEPVDEEAQIPSYVKQIVEVAGRTLSLEEFVVPRFSFVNNEASVVKATKVDENVITEQVGSKKKDEESIEEPLTVIDDEVVVEDEKGNFVAEEVTTVATAAGAATATAIVSSVPLLDEMAAPLPTPNVADTEVNKETKTEAEKEPVVSAAETKTESATEDDFLAIFKDAGFTETEGSTKNDTVELVTPSVADEKEKAVDKKVEPESTIAVEPPAIVSAAAVVTPEKSPEKKLDLGYNNADRAILNREQKMADAHSEASTSESKKAELAKTTETEDNDLGLSFFANSVTDSAETEVAPVPEKVSPKEEADPISKPADVQKIDSKTAKQKGDMGQFLKKFFLFILIFVVTIALGIGVGLLILKISGKDFFNKDNLPTPEPTVLPTALPTMPEASDAAAASESAAAEDETAEELDPADFKILVVNATGVAGYAGETKTALEKEGFVNVKTGNSKGTYDETGTFVLMEDKNSALIKLLETGSGFTLIYDEDYQTEDPSGVYDAVIVLNDKS
ncbi:MAG: LytR C-terminal domain-containing protein [bacterium]|nr:LytR C-terminal domain-containing protein [bacterium]